MMAYIKSDDDEFRKWLASMKEATISDKFSEVLGKGILSHSHGWGMASIGDGERYFRTIEPFFSNGPPVMMTNAGKAGIIHARYNTSTKFSIISQTHPFRIDAGKHILYVAHNGSVEKEILNELIPKGRRLDKSGMGFHSDTQMLSWYLGYMIGRQKKTDRKFWIDALSEVIKRHEEISAEYSMQLIMLHLKQEGKKLRWSIIAVSAISEGRMKYWSYYRMFESRKGGRYIASSSIAIPMNATKELKNKSIVMISEEGREKGILI